MASQLRVDKIVPVDGAPTGGGGGIVQVKCTTKQDMFDTSSTSFVDVTGLNVSITPKFSTSKMLVTVHVFASCEDASMLRLMFDSTAVGNGTASDQDANHQGFAMVRQSGNNLGSGYGIQILHTPGNTSSHTYKVQARTTAASYPLSINRRGSSFHYSLASSITVEEVAA